MKGLYIGLLVFTLSACSTHMYVAKTEFADGDRTCLAQAYWYKTDYVIGSKTDRVLTVTAGGQRTAVQYQERDGALVYMGEASRDVKVFGAAPAAREFPCGHVLGLQSLQQFTGEQLSLSMHCQARRDELSVGQGYLPAQEAPYQFTVQRETLFSFTGAVPAAPRPPGCSPR